MLNSTKLFYPPILEDYVPRVRLQERLKLIARRPLTLVSAPAGYGKTTAVSAWLENSGLVRAWLSLDEGDNDLTTFLPTWWPPSSARWLTSGWSCQG